MELKTFTATSLVAAKAGEGHTRRLGLRVVAGIALLVAAAALAASGSGRTLHAHTAAGAISGSYALNTLGGRPVPATARDTTIEDPWGRGSIHLAVLVTGGTVTLTPSGTYRVDAACRVELNGNLLSAQRCAEGGRYVVTGSTVTFTSSVSDVLARGTRSDGSLTVSADVLGAEALMLHCLAGECTPADNNSN